MAVTGRALAAYERETLSVGFGLRGLSPTGSICFITTVYCSRRLTSSVSIDPRPVVMVGVLQPICNRWLPVVEGGKRVPVGRVPRVLVIDVWSVGQVSVQTLEQGIMFRNFSKANEFISTHARVKMKEVEWRISEQGAQLTLCANQRVPCFRHQPRRHHEGDN